MKKLDINQYCDDFIDAAKLQGDATQAGNSRVANRQYTKLKRIYLQAQKDVESSKCFYKNLRKNEAPNVRLWAAAHSLALNIDIPEAENVLDALGREKEIGIISLNAAMTLKVWKQQGFLRF